MALLNYWHYSLLNYTEATVHVDELNREFPTVSIISAVNFNQLSYRKVTAMTRYSADSASTNPWCECTGSHFCFTTYVLPCRL